MRFVELKYDFGDTVYLKTDQEQLPRIVTAVSLRPNGNTYEIYQGTWASWHYDFEITKEKNIQYAL